MLWKDRVNWFLSGRRITYRIPSLTDTAAFTWSSQFRYTIWIPWSIFRWRSSWGRWLWISGQAWNIGSATKTRRRLEKILQRKKLLKNLQKSYTRWNKNWVRWSENLYLTLFYSFVVFSILPVPSGFLPFFTRIFLFFVCFFLYWFIFYLFSCVFLNFPAFCVFYSLYVSEHLSSILKF